MHIARYELPLIPRMRTSPYRLSRKFIYEILHNPTRIRAEDGPFPRPDTYEAFGYGCSEGYYVLVASGRRQALKQPGGATGRTSSATTIHALSPPAHLHWTGESLPSPAARWSSPGLLRAPGRVPARVCVGSSPL